MSARHFANPMPVGDAPSYDTPQNNLVICAKKDESP